MFTTNNDKSNLHISITSERKIKYARSLKSTEAKMSNPISELGCSHQNCLCATETP